MGFRVVRALDLEALVGEQRPHALHRLVVHMAHVPLEHDIAVLERFQKMTTVRGPGAEAAARLEKPIRLLRHALGVVRIQVLEEVRCDDHVVRRALEAGFAPVGAHETQLVVRVGLESPVADLDALLAEVDANDLPDPVGELEAESAPSAAQIDHAVGRCRVVDREDLLHAVPLEATLGVDEVIRALFEVVAGVVELLPDAGFARHRRRKICWNLSHQTRHTASRTIRFDILDSPLSRSVKRMGTSVNENPLHQARNFSSIWNA